MKKRILAGLMAGVLALTLTGCTDFKKDVIEYIYGQASAPQEIKRAECVSEGRYMHDVLGGDEQIIYDEMLATVLEFKEESNLLVCQDEAQIEKCYNAMMDDHGEIFWLEGAGYVFKDSPNQVEFYFQPQYSMTLEEKNQFTAAMRKEIKRYTKALKKCDTDYEKCKKAYEMLVESVAYDENSEFNQDIRSVFIDKATVCAGYSKALQMLLAEQEIECSVVHGTTIDGVAHSWNMVKLDDEYYYIDVTWGNPTYNTAVDTGVCYDYLCLNEYDLAYTHVFDTGVELPKSRGNEFNYYVQSGCYFEEWDKDAVCKIIKNAYKKGDASVSVRFSNGIFMSQAMEYLIDEDGVYKCCKDMNSFHYSTDSNLSILTIIFSGE